MSRGVIRRRWIGIALSLVWLLGAAAVFNHRRALEVRHLARECHQLRADARASTLCSEENAAVAESFCRYKDADCDRWPSEQARFAENMALFALAPVVLAWLIYYAALRYFRRRRNT